MFECLFIIRRWGIHKPLSLSLSELAYAENTQIAVLYACWFFLTEVLNVPISLICLREAQIKFVSPLVSQLCAKHVFLRFPWLRATVSYLQISKGTLFAMDSCVSPVLCPPSPMQLTKRDRVPSMSHCLLHPKSRCFISLRACSELHRRVPRQY